MTGQGADAERERSKASSENHLCQDSENSAKGQQDVSAGPSSESHAPAGNNQSGTNLQAEKGKATFLAAQKKRRNALIIALLVLLLCVGVICPGFIHRRAKTDVTQMSVQTDKKLAELNQAIEREPNNPQLYMERARLFYFDREEAANAYTDLSRTIQIAPELVDAYLLRSDVGAFLHRYEQAQADVDKAAGLTPNSPAVYVQRAHLEEIMEDHNKAIADCQRALALEPQNFLAFGELGSAYQGLGRYAVAARCITRQLEMHKEPQPWPLNFLSRGMAKFYMRDFDGAIDDENSALKIKPDLGTARIIRSYAEAAKGNVALAEADAARGLVEESVPSRGHRLVGDLYRYLGNHERAVEEYGKAISQNALAVNSYRGRGVSYYRLGQLNNALEDFQQAVKLNPASTTLSYLALIEEVLGESKNADRDISAALHQSSPTSIVYSNSAAIKYSRRNLDGALIDAKKSLEMDRYNADAWQLLGTILKAKGNSKEAQVYLDRAREYGYPNSVPPPAW